MSKIEVSLQQLDEINTKLTAIARIISSLRLKYQRTDCADWISKGLEEIHERVNKMQAEILKHKNSLIDSLIEKLYWEVEEA